MFMTKLKVAAFVMMAAALIGSGTGAFMQAGLGQTQSEPAKLVAKAPPDNQQIQGTWVLVSAVVDGEETPEEVLKQEGHKRVFKADKFIIHRADQPDSPGEVAYKLDSSKRPKSIDMIPAAGPDKGNTVPGIYRLEADTLTVCEGFVGEARPTELTSKAGSKRVLTVFRREDNTAAKPPALPKNLSEEDLKKLLNALKDADADVRQAAIEALKKQDASKTKPVARAVALQFVSAFLAESEPAKVLEFFDPDADRKSRGKGTAVEIIKRELELPRRLRESAKLREIVFFSTKEDVAKLAERYPGETMWGRLPTQIDQVKDGVGCLVVSEGPEEGTTGLGAFVFKKVGDNYRIVYMDDN